MFKISLNNPPTSSNPNPSSPKTVIAATPNSQSQPEAPTLPTEEPDGEAAFSAGSADHFDALLRGADVSAQGGGGEGGSGASFVGKDAFYALFCGGFRIGNAVTGLKSLAIPQGDASARECSDAIYEICEETPLLNFVIQPGGKWLQRMTAIGMFAVPMTMNVQAEIAARKNSAPRSGPLNVKMAPQTSQFAGMPQVKVEA